MGDKPRYALVSLGSSDQSRGCTQCSGQSDNIFGDFPDFESLGEGPPRRNSSEPRFCESANDFTAFALFDADNFNIFTSSLLQLDTIPPSYSANNSLTTCGHILCNGGCL